MMEMMQFLRRCNFSEETKMLKILGKRTATPGKNHALKKWSAEYPGDLLTLKILGAFQHKKENICALNLEDNVLSKEDFLKCFPKPHVKNLIELLRPRNIETFQGESQNIFFSKPCSNSVIKKAHGCTLRQCSEAHQFEPVWSRHQTGKDYSNGHKPQVWRGSNSRRTYFERKAKLKKLK